jgi:hypothetical protein
MLQLLADENFNNNIVRGLPRRAPEIDIVRVQDVGLSGANDPTLLAWAAECLKFATYRRPLPRQTPEDSGELWFAALTTS